MISPVHQRDLDEIAGLTPPGWTHLGQVFAAYLVNSQARAIKLTLGKEIAGVGASIGLERSAWLAHIVVNPKCRNQGVGGHIVDFLCQNLEKGGMQTISLLATDLGEPVYARNGFRNLGHYETFTLKQALEEGNATLRPFAPEDMDALLRFDLDYSGEQRARLLEPHLSSTLLAFEDEVLKGYYMPGWGEGHIVASSQEAARSLLALRSKEKLTFSLPAANHALCAHVLELGATMEEKYIVRMERGVPLDWKAEWCCARIGGNLG